MYNHHMLLYQAGYPEYFKGKTPWVSAATCLDSNGASRFLANRPQRLLGQFLLAYRNIYTSKFLYGYKVIYYYIILYHIISYYIISYYIILYYVVPIYAYINSPVFPLKFLQLPRSFRSQRRPGAHVVLPSSPALGWCHIAADRGASHRARHCDTGGVVARRCGDVVGGFGLMSDSSDIINLYNYSIQYNDKPTL